MHFQQGQFSVSGLARTFQSLSELEQALEMTDGFRLRQAGSTERDAQGAGSFTISLIRKMNMPRSLDLWYALSPGAVPGTGCCLWFSPACGVVVAD
jgi:hypothetical protein